MKTLKLIVAGIMLQLIFFGTFLLISNAGQAQVSVNVNIGSPPPWGPVGYTEVRYYYLPDVEAYYDVQTSMFIYFGGGVWVHRSYLPSRYRNYDLYGGYKVVMTDYRGDAPYNNFREYKTRYARGYHGEAQRTIGERPGRGNSGAKKSHEGNNGNNGNGRGNGKSEGHGNDKGEGHGHKEGNGKQK